MPGDNVITRNWGDRDDDSMSDIYTTDGTSWVAPIPESQVSRAARANAAVARDDDSMSDLFTTDGTEWVAPALESQVSRASRANGAVAPTDVVVADSGIFRRSSNIPTDSYHVRAPESDASNDDDSMVSDIYTTDGVSVTQETERFRESVQAEERKILKEYSLDSKSGSFESYPNGLLLPTTLITAKAPSPKKKKKQKWSPFVGSVGTNDFDLESIESDGIRQGEKERGGLGRFQVLGIKARMGGSPVGTEKTRSPSSSGGPAALSTSYDDAFPELEQAEGGYAGRSKDTSANAKKKAATAAAGASIMRPRVCRCRLEKVIWILVGVMVIALATAIGALVAAKQSRGGNEEDLSAAEFQSPSQSAPTPSGQTPTLSQVATPAPAPSSLLVSSKVASLSPVTFSPSKTPTPGPTKLKSTKGSTNSPAFVLTETASPTGLRATEVPTNSPIFVVLTQLPTTQRPTAAPVMIEEIQSPTSAPVAATATAAPVSLTVTQSPASADDPTPACEDAVDELFFVSLPLGMRDCTWLAVNPVFQIGLCSDGQEANNVCRATCNNCGLTSAPITAPAATSGPTLAPSPPPVAAPAPTNAPIGTPTNAPIGTPTNAPIGSPTNAPIGTPTNAPIGAPTLSPSVAVELLARDLILARSPASTGALNNNRSSQSQALAWLESDSTAETLSDELLVQRWVMATFAFSVDYESWDSNNSWLGNADVCSWFGIACDNGGNVVTVALRNNGLDGTLPSELSLLRASLRSMDVGNNELTGGFPSAFTRLTNLETLRINSNAMTGEIPARLGDMTSLVVLDFQRNRFSGPVPQSIANLDNLNELLFNTNEMTGVVPTSVCDFDNLEALVLDCREIECDCWTQCYYQCGGSTGVVCLNQ
jgi:hypothetical protein